MSNMWHCWDPVEVGDDYGPDAASYINYSHHSQSSCLGAIVIVANIQVHVIWEFHQWDVTQRNHVSEFRVLERKQLKWFTMGLNILENKTTLEVLFNNQKVEINIY